MNYFRSVIAGVSQFYPDNIVTNKDFEKTVDTSDEWIRTRTGISQRRKAAPGQGSSELAIKAIQTLLKKQTIKAKDIDLIICATITPDRVFPANANYIQKSIKAHNAWGFDLSAACSGFLYALSTADQFIRCGNAKNVLVIGTEVMSSIIDPLDRNTCVIFGDGCGVVLLQAQDKASDLGILDSILHMDGTGVDYLYQEAGGSIKPPTIETVKNREHFAYQDGKHVFKHAVTAMSDVCKEILDKNDLKVSDIDHFISHQANIRIIESVQKKLKLDPSKVINNIEMFGNTTAATIPTCLAKACQEKKFKKGDLILLTAFGAGFTWGATLLRWAY